MEELANKLFESREVAHNFHFNTKSYAKHMALQNYYENILPLADDLVEIYQGQYELIGDYTQIKETPILDDFILYFEGVIKYVKEARYTQLSKEDTHLQNIISGNIPFKKTGSHRRILLQDLITYEKKIANEREKQLDFLANQAQKLNLGYE